MTLQFHHAAAFCHRGLLRRQQPRALPLFASFSSSAAARAVRATPTQRRPGDNFVNKNFPTWFTPDPVFPKVDIVPSNKSGVLRHDLSALRPPPLDFVDPPRKDENGNTSVTERAKYWYRWGKSLVKFYKAGLYKVWANFKELNKLRARLGPGSSAPGYIEHCALYGGDKTVGDQHGRPFPAITRKEYLLWHRARHDLFKLLPFSLMLMICGEFTPLLILATGTWMLPSTCRRPADQAHDLKALCKRLDYFVQSKDDRFERAADNFSEPVSEPGFAPQNSMVYRRHLTWSYVLTGNPIYKLSRDVPWENLVYNMSWGSKKLAKRYTQIVADTVLIMREGGFDSLSAEDIYEYCVFCASPNFLRLAKQALANGTDPANEAMRKAMVPILNSYAKTMLDIDWTRFAPSLAWRLELINRVLDPRAPDTASNTVLANLLKEMPPTK